MKQKIHVYDDQASAIKNKFKKSQLMLGRISFVTFLVEVKIIIGGEYPSPFVVPYNTVHVINGTLSPEVDR